MKLTYSSLLVNATLVALLFVASQAAAQAPSLGTSASFGVLAGSTVTNTGPSTVKGDLGVSPGTAIVGFPPGVVTLGATHSADAAALNAQNDVTTAYVGLAGLPCGTDKTGQDLGGQTLVAGVYCFSSSAQLTGTLTLDAQGNPNAQFIFQIGSTLTTASNAIVSVINGGNNCNVYWQVGSSATIGTATAFAGNILALTSITVTTGASVQGRLLARNGAVTLDTNSVAVCPVCTPITLSPSLPNGTISVVYSQTITASGGTAPYAFTLISGTLPPGLTLSSVGVVSGTPTTGGSSTFTVSATDAAGCFGSRIYTMVMNAAGCVLPIILVPSTIPAATGGAPYGPVTIMAIGGAAPYTFAVTLGALPSGLTLSSAGVISGTPTQSGSFTVTITATDSLGCQGSQIYSALVGCPPITISPATLPVGTVGAPYNPVTITASGGTGPYTFTYLGSLPPGLTLSAGGILSGTPTTSGSFQFTVTATDSVGCQGARPYTMAVAAVYAAGGPTLDSMGLAVLILLLTAAGVLLVNRFTV